MYGEILVQTLVSGLMIGLIYALVAIGLTLIFGVMDIVNFAHGEFLMFGMYSSFWLYALYALDPLFTLPLTALFLFMLGSLLYKLVIKKITNAPMVSQIFTTFGLVYICGIITTLSVTISVTISVLIWILVWILVLVLLI